MRMLLHCVLIQDNGMLFLLSVLVRAFPHYSPANYRLLIVAVSDTENVYIAVGATLGILLVAIIVIVLIITAVGVSLNRFKGTLHVQCSQ